MNVTAETPQPWIEHALCRQVDPEQFYAEGAGTKRRTQEAKKQCKLCPVRLVCLAYALKRDERYGVWGGLDEDERAALNGGAA